MNRQRDDDSPVYTRPLDQTFLLKWAWPVYRPSLSPGNQSSCV